MHPLLSKLLQKRKIQDPNELSAEEKVTFEQWNLILNKEELTVEEIKLFLQNQISVIEQKWADLNKDNQSKAELIPVHTVYKLLLSAINSPKQAREAVVASLTQLINK